MSASWNVGDPSYNQRGFGDPPASSGMGRAFNGDKCNKYMGMYLNGCDIASTDIEFGDN